MINGVECELVNKTSINDEYFVLQFVWEHTAPKAGQFFMLRLSRSSVFLPRPISIFEFNAEEKIVKFLIVKRGTGTIEFSQLNIGEKVLLIGPLGNRWDVYLPELGRAALVSGSAGIAPFSALINEQPNYHFQVYAGFRQGFREKEVEDQILGHATRARKVIVAAEDGRNALIGKVVDFIVEPENFDVIFGCGPIPMLKALKIKCEAKGIPCYLSLESRFACGVGVCHGCTVHTISGNKRCCKEGPIFPSTEVKFDE